MANVSIENKYLIAEINPDGAELKSLKSKETGIEYIWQANPEFWNRSAPILFPIVGAVENNTIQVEGKEYSLPRHGFVRDMRLEVATINEKEVEYYLKSSTETLAKYPFQFYFSVKYQLNENKLKTVFTVKNTDTKNIYFSVGAHPAFNLPSGNISDYFIEFEKEETLNRHLLKNNTFSGETERVIANTNHLPLSTALFDKDAIVFKDMQSQSFSLKSKTNDYKVRMDFDGFPYFGIWTKPNCEKFVCLEPWCGLADNSGFDDEFKNKEGINILTEGATFQRSFTIEV
jgi:galactose mutarotase-like enzyme